MTIIEKLTGDCPINPVETTPGNTFSEEQTETMNRLFIQLEKKLLTEMQHQIDITFLELYTKENLVPRGLRINLQPTFHDDTDFSDAWHNILDECLSKLMNIILIKRSKICTIVNSDIRDIMVDLNNFTDHHLYPHVNQKVTTIAQKHELDLINRKCTTLNRDRNATPEYRPMYKFNKSAIQPHTPTTPSKRPQKRYRPYPSTQHLHHPYSRNLRIQSLMDIKTKTPSKFHESRKPIYINHKQSKSPNGEQPPPTALNLQKESPPNIPTRPPSPLHLATNDNPFTPTNKTKNYLIKIRNTIERLRKEYSDNFPDKKTSHGVSVTHGPLNLSSPHRLSTRPHHSHCT